MSQLSLVDFLVELGQAAAEAQIGAIKQSVDTLLTQDILDVTIPLGDEKIKVDGVSLLPRGFPNLKKLTIETETDVERIRTVDKSKGFSPKLKMSMTKGLFQRGVHVKILAEYETGSELEAIEVLRERADEKVREAIEKIRNK